MTPRDYGKLLEPIFEGKADNSAAQLALPGLVTQRVRVFLSITPAISS